MNTKERLKELAKLLPLATIKVETGGLKVIVSVLQNVLELLQNNNQKVPSMNGLIIFLNQ